MSKFKNQNVRIVKLIDTKFEGNHPNGIVEGTEKEGKLIVFEVGQSVLLTTEKIYFETSEVTSINENLGMFFTKNSLYKIELIEKIN